MSNKPDLSNCPDIEEYLSRLIEDAHQAGVQKVYVGVGALLEAVTTITTQKSALLLAGLDKDQWENCPNCPNQGGYMVNETDAEQCEFCWTNPRSVFYQENKLWKEGE